MNRPTKRYIVWTSNGGGQYVPTEYDAVVDALLDEKYTSDWFLTETINDVSAYSGYKAPPKVVPANSGCPHADCPKVKYRNCPTHGDLAPLQ